MADALVLRTVYLPDSLDEKLKVRAFNNRVSKNELIRGYLEAAIRAESADDGTSLNKDSLRARLTNATAAKKAAPGKSPRVAGTKTVRKVAAKKTARKTAPRKG